MRGPDAFHRRPLAVAALAVVAAGALGADPAGPTAERLSAEVLERANRLRGDATGEPLARSAALETAAARRAQQLAAEVADLPTAKPRHVTALVDLGDLTDLLRAAGFEARQASAHVVVADRPLRAVELIAGEAGLRADLLDPSLRELGLGVARQGSLEILVAIVARSKEMDFALLTQGLGDFDRVRSELLRRTNEARRERRRRPLRPDRCLQRAAQDYAERMLAEGFYGHFSPEGQDVAFRVRGGGCPRRHVGENLARGQTSARQVVDGWLESPEHRQSLLHADFWRVGFGIALGRKGDEYWVLWVQVLSGD